MQVGPLEIVIVLVIALLIFGGKFARGRSVGGGLGSSISGRLRRTKDAVTDAGQELKEGYHEEPAGNSRVGRAARRSRQQVEAAGKSVPAAAREAKEGFVEEGPATSRVGRAAEGAGTAHPLRGRHRRQHRRHGGARGQGGPHGRGDRDERPRRPCRALRRQLPARRRPVAQRDGQGHARGPGGQGRARGRGRRGTGRRRGSARRSSRRRRTSRRPASARPPDRLLPGPTVFGDTPRVSGADEPRRDAGTRTPRGDGRHPGRGRIPRPHGRSRRSRGRLLLRRRPRPRHADDARPRARDHRDAHRHGRLRAAARRPPPRRPRGRRQRGGARGDDLPGAAVLRRAAHHQRHAGPARASRRRGRACPVRPFASSIRPARPLGRLDGETVTDAGAAEPRGLRADAGGLAAARVGRTGELRRRRAAPARAGAAAQDHLHRPQLPRPRGGVRARDPRGAGGLRQVADGGDRPGRRRS